jgi:AraC family transcriptional activator of pobA
LQQKNNEMKDLQNEFIHPVDMARLGNGQYIDYTDGDVAIIDNVRELTQISPMYSYMNFIILCTKGRIQFDLNGTPVTLEENEILLSAPSVVLSNYLLSIDFECKILCMTDKVVQTLLHDYINIWNNAVYINRTTLVSLSEEHQTQFCYYYELLHFKWEHQDSLFVKSTMQSVIRAMLVDLCGLIYKPTEDGAEHSVSRGRLLVDRFLNMLAGKEIKRLSVHEYAGQLAVSSKYLTMMCKKYTEKTPSQWIDQYLTEDIRYYLTETDLSMKEICNKLEFSTISFFGSYVKRHLGCSPKNYRYKERT